MVYTVFQLFLSSARPLTMARHSELMWSDCHKRTEGLSQLRSKKESAKRLACWPVDPGCREKNRVKTEGQRKATQRRTNRNMGVFPAVIRSPAFGLESYLWQLEARNKLPQKSGGPVASKVRLPIELPKDNKILDCCPVACLWFITCRHSEGEGSLS